MTLGDIVSEYILGNLTVDELQQALDDWLYSEICKDLEYYETPFCNESEE